MTSLAALWLPIVLSTVFVFVVSSLIHMGPLWHKTDYPPLSNQDQVMGALRPLGIPPGDYMIPRPADMKEMRSDAFKEKVKSGPVVIMTIIPFRGFSMGRPLSLWFVYILVNTFLAAYVGGVALPPAAAAINVARILMTVSFIGYAVALWQLSIWYSRSWSITMKSTLDGLIYSAITAATFAWLWPR